MLNIEVSKVVPHNALAFLTFLIPGCFFEVSVLLANPQLLAKPVSDLHQTIPVSPYLLLSSALFIAFIIGSAAIVFVALLIRILKGVYAIRTSLVTAMLTTFLKIIAKRTPLTTTPLHSAYKRRTNADNADRAWRRLAAKLLLDRYGIQPRHLKADWAFYMVALSNPTHEEVTGSMMMHVFHATGWCGLVATLLAPALRTSYYLALCLMLIAGGLVVGYTTAANLEDPLNIALLNMRAVVREYEKGRAPSKPEV